jgi:hypothetical protein
MFLVVELIVAIGVLAVRPGKLTSSYRADATGSTRGGERPGPGAVLPTLPPTTAPPPPASVDSVPPGQQLPGNQAVVTGTITSVQASTATLGTVPTPINVVAAERGSGNSATINGAQLDGKPADIEWDAGTPFPLSGDGGGITLTGVTVHVDASTATVQLGGGSYALTPGNYHLASPAAVSSNGLASPVTSVDFTAVAGTSVTFVGSETLDLPLPVHLTGPGKVVLDGTFTVRTAQGSRPASHVELASGPYDLKVAPGPGGTQITAILQGSFSIA